MATRLERNIREDYLTCSICLSTFDKPRQLDCKHSYCLTCLLDYIKPEAPVLICPTCRAEMKRPSTMTVKEFVNTLPEDLLLTAIINAVEKHSPDSKEEENGNDSSCKRHACSLEYFCHNHREAICNDCVSNYHKKCDYVPLSDAHLKANSMLNEIDSKLEKRLQDLANLEQLGIQSLVSYQKLKTDAKVCLKKVQQNFEKLSKVILADINEKSDSLNWPEVNMRSTLKSIQINRDHLERARAETSAIRDSENVVLKIKSLENFNKNTYSLLERDAIDDFCFRSYQITLIENEDLISAMTNLRDVGRLEIVSADDSVSGAEEALSLIDPETVFQSYRKRECSVTNDIRHHCSLSGVCIIESFVIVIDQYNNAVIKMTFEGDCVDKISLQEPHQACRTEGTMVAVTCWDRNQLFILETEPLSIVRTFETGKHYLGIHGVGSDRLLVTSPDSSIDVISTNGEILFSINTKRSRNILTSLFKGTLSVPIKAVMKDDCVIVYDSMQKFLLCLDFAGKIRWQKKIRTASSFAVGKEEIYCTLSRSNKIVTLTFDGQIKDSSFLEIKHPWAVDVVDKTLVVTEDSPSGIFHLVHFE